MKFRAEYHVYGVCDQCFGSRYVVFNVKSLEIAKKSARSRIRKKVGHNNFQILYVVEQPQNKLTLKRLKQPIALLCAPNPVLDHLINVQPMDKKTGAAFYLDVNSRER
jgi:hypothetical protein